MRKRDFGFFGCGNGFAYLVLVIGTEAQKVEGGLNEDRAQLIVHDFLRDF